MRVSELLMAVASWLENPNNEALQLAEVDEAALEATARACAAASLILKQGAEEVSFLEPTEEKEMTVEKLDHLNSIIAAFDQSNDEELKKTANVLDELLILSVGPEWVKNYKAAEEKKIDVLKAKYEDVNKQLHLENKTEESAKKIDASPMMKEYREIAPGLSQRCCPDHPGSLMARTGDHQFQCQLDKKNYNYELGFTDMQGRVYPGGSPSHEFDLENRGVPHQLFDTREERTNGYLPNKRW